MSNIKNSARYRRIEDAARHGQCVMGNHTVKCTKGWKIVVLYRGTPIIALDRYSGTIENLDNPYNEAASTKNNQKLYAEALHAWHVDNPLHPPKSKPFGWLTLKFRS